VEGIRDLSAQNRSKHQTSKTGRAAPAERMVRIPPARVKVPAITPKFDTKLDHFC